MSNTKRDKHGWLRSALADAGKQQKDLAEAWGVTAAVVSRFIASGEPSLNPERMKVLCDMFELDANELMVVLQTGQAPRAGAIARAVAARETRAMAPANAQPVPREATASPGGIIGAVKELDEAAARAQALLPPGLKVIYSIEKE